MFDYYYNLETVDLKNFGKKNNKESERMCTDCGVERIRVDHTIVCPMCGGVVEHLEILTPEYFKEPAGYKRLPYFKEQLKKVQGKVMVVLPPELLPKLRVEVLKLYPKGRRGSPERASVSGWTFFTLRKVLKKLGYPYLYPDLVYIWSLLFPDRPIPKLTPQQEAAMITAFLKIQGNWSSVKPKKRKAMLSNQYIIKKLSHLYDIPLVGECLGYPKDVRKLIEYDTIWAKFCQLFNWKFYSSF
jgi:hypothetical protein